MNSESICDLNSLYFFTLSDSGSLGLRPRSLSALSMALKMSESIMPPMYRAVMNPNIAFAFVEGSSSSSSSSTAHLYNSPMASLSADAIRSLDPRNTALPVVPATRDISALLGSYASPVFSPVAFL